MFTLYNYNQPLRRKVPTAVAEEAELPYLAFGFASAAAFLDFGLPPQLAWLKRFKVVLLHWTLLKLELLPNAVLLPSPPGRKYPVVVSSHGNGGTRAIASTLLEEMVSWGQCRNPLP